VEPIVAPSREMQPGDDDGRGRRATARLGRRLARIPLGPRRSGRTPRSPACPVRQTCHDRRPARNDGRGRRGRGRPGVAPRIRIRSSVQIRCRRPVVAVDAGRGGTDPHVPSATGRARRSGGADRGDEGNSGPSWRRVFAPAEQAGVPVFLLAPDVIDIVPATARAYPDLQIVLDHLGAVASSSVGDGARGLARVPDLLKLAQFDNVALKCTNVPSLSTTGFPFNDIWPHLHAILEAFGPECLMWGSDITVHPDDLTYAQSLGYLQLSDQFSTNEKDLILGASLRRILRWPRKTEPLSSGSRPNDFVN
jgi:hypothetical protein